ncbi:MAG: hypothetical protein JSV65_05395 [Armatimonadota bacterium]|nr:MAG: hypothetical protein JSV65_05395 [Armatimonadota bacterium]
MTGANANAGANDHVGRARGSQRVAAVTVVALAVALTGALAQANPEAEAGRLDLGAARLAASAGVSAAIERIAPSDDRSNGIKVTFTKDGPERRLVAVEAAVPADLPAARALEVTYRADVEAGQAPRLALMVFEDDGGVWFRVSQQPVSSGAWTSQRISLKSLRQAAFSEDPGGDLQWRNLQRIWVGMVVDGAARGSIAIGDALLTSEPYTPSGPLRITGGGTGEWGLAHDPAVRARLSTPNEGPDAKACMKFEFFFPGQRHMYALPSTPVPVSDVEGYRALRFTYRAALPEGIKGLLISLWEQGGAQYEAMPYPPPTDEWRTITIPFDSFRLGAWSRDTSGQLELERVSRVVIGVHGAALGDGGDGTIWAADIEFVP